MQVTVRTVDGKMHCVEVPEGGTIATLCDLLHQSHSFIRTGMKIVFKGEVKEESQLIKDLAPAPTDSFIVVGKRTNTPFSPPPSTSTPAATTSGESEAKRAKTEETRPATVEPKEDLVRELQDMGIPRSEARRALVKTENDLQAAVNLLMGEDDGSDEEGDEAYSFGSEEAQDFLQALFGGHLSEILEEMEEDEEAEAKEQGAGTAAPATPAPPAASNPLPSDSDLVRELRKIPDFEELRRRVSKNPTALHAVIATLRQQRPAAFQLIQHNQTDFLRILHHGLPQEDEKEEKEGGKEEEEKAEEKVEEQGAQGGEDGEDGLTASDHEAISRLVALTCCEVSAARQAYLAMEKNEEAAANLLLDS